ncbi:hypothetical protein EXS74_00600 [Candidatus Woesearchaeota archaeon]|nr:hypothetical protein [Candidatus Woesearchaeota archaeon]
MIYDIYENSLDSIEDGSFMVSDSEYERINDYYAENYDLIPTESESNEIIDAAFQDTIALEDEANDLLVKATRSYNEAIDIYNEI